MREANGCFIRILGCSYPPLVAQYRAIGPFSNWGSAWAVVVGRRQVQNSGIIYQFKAGNLRLAVDDEIRSAADSLLTFIALIGYTPAENLPSD
jgi:hypothetical protein